jgi:glycine/D-amino acid oxidase-like deaminating enzyme
MRHTIVIGGGIAGLALAWQLAGRGGRRVTLLERETFTGTHSSARNAQIWLPVDDDTTTGPLARRTVALLNELLGDEREWLRRSAAVVLAPDDAAARAIEGGAERGGVRARRLSEAELAERSPVLDRSGDAAGEPALAIEGAGVFEPSVMIRALERACRERGVEVRVGVGVGSIRVDGRVRGVVLEDGRELAGDEVVIAAGAWAGALGAAIGAPVPLVPLRRHLVVLEADPRRAGTTVWRFGTHQVYYRPESGGVLASPCDEQPFEPCLPPADASVLEQLADELAPVAPALIDAPIRTKWACLRTYALDRELVLGPDPRVEGLAWMVGFGGRGMTVAVGAAERCAAALNGLEDPLLACMRADRRFPADLVEPHS